MRFDAPRGHSLGIPPKASVRYTILMKLSTRHDGRAVNELRPVKFTVDFVRSAKGSCLIEMGNTRVICTASFVPEVPSWRKGGGQGWLTAEYGMLPASTGSRKSRPGLKPDSRGLEIQRLIGRVLRTVVRLDKLGENSLYLDCDVLQADGGTRTASVTGAYVALRLAERALLAEKKVPGRFVQGAVAAVSVGIVQGRPVLDLDYHEDSAADVDMNIAMTLAGKYVELQGSSERQPFDAQQLQQMLALGTRGARQLLAQQRRVLA